MNKTVYLIVAAIALLWSASAQAQLAWHRDDSTDPLSRKVTLRAISKAVFERDDPAQGQAETIQVTAVCVDWNMVLDAKFAANTDEEIWFDVYKGDPLTPMSL